MSAIEYADPDDEDRVRERFLEAGHVEAFETTFVTNDGGTVGVLLSGTPDDGEFTGYVIDITDRKRLERKAAEQAEAILEDLRAELDIGEGVVELRE